MQSCGLECKPEEVSNLKGDADRAGFINTSFKEVQRLKNTARPIHGFNCGKHESKIESLLPEEQMRSFKGAYSGNCQSG